MWFCSDCHSKVGITLRFFNGIRSKQEESDKKINELEKRMDDMETKFEESQDKLEEVTTAVEMSAKKTEVQECKTDMMDRIAILEEATERSKREKNLIIHKVAESSKTESEARKLDDIQQVVSVLEALNIGGSCNEDRMVQVNSTARLGAKRPDNKPRLLKVTFNSKEVRDRVLREAKSLKDLTDANIKSLFIVPDLTPRERVEDKKLRAELKARRDQGEQDLFIRRGKITRKKAPGQNSEQVHANSAPV